MTEQAMMEQRVRVEIELKDAEKKLSALQVKATRMADDIDAVSSKIRHNADLEPSADDLDADVQVLENRLSGQNRAALNVDQVAGVIEELRLARQKVIKLTRQREKLEP